ncbi:MAG: GAF domain-containing sensor histidine kinase [Caulobacteraceae bacterium]
MAEDLETDILVVGRVAAVPSILEVICRTTGMGFAAVARVTPERWIACGVHDEIDFGLKPGGELKVETTICHEIRQSGEPVVIDHVAEDSVYCTHHTPAMYGFQSYISMPIILKDGSFFGTLCAIDPRPALVSKPEVVGMFRLFAELIAVHIDASRQLVSTEAILSDERRSSELREQFIAVLGHDLRNPLASIDAGMRMLLRDAPSEKSAGIVKLIQSSVQRMAGLIDNVLDFARGRLGGGLPLHHREEAMAPILDQVVAESRSSRPDREIATVFALAAPVYCDRSRIGQLFSNLVGNALTYGAPDMPVRVRASSDAEAFELSVSNSGPPIPPAALERLFMPFERGAVSPHQEGLGLGLYIASEIAKAHGGTLQASSAQGETTFTFRMASSQ